MLFRNPRALSSTLAPLGSLQPQAVGFLNRVDPSDSASNYYVDEELSRRDCQYCIFEFVAMKPLGEKLTSGVNNLLCQTYLQKLACPVKVKVTCYLRRCKTRKEAST